MTSTFQELRGGEWEDVDHWEDAFADEGEVQKASLWANKISYD